MTKVEAGYLQATWCELGSPRCEHRKIDLERSEDGYMTGNYRCIGCGEEMAPTWRGESRLRSEVQGFIHSCERFAEFSQQHNGFTEDEREAVLAVFIYFLHGLDWRVITPPQQKGEDMAA